jgi:hypothetical protein
MATLRPGNMGSATGLPNIKPSEFANSMADTMDSTFRELLILEGMHPFEIDTNSKDARDRRRIFVAIAQGVVRHLIDNSAALLIVDSAKVPTGETIQIQADTTLL